MYCYESCPKCGIIFDPSNFWKLTAPCGHEICRHCAIISNYICCSQCKLHMPIYEHEGVLSQEVQNQEEINVPTFPLTEFLEVHLTEPPTHFMISHAHSEPEIIQSESEANAFTFTSDSDPESCSIPFVSVHPRNQFTWSHCKESGWDGAPNDDESSEKSLGHDNEVWENMPEKSAPIPDFITVLQGDPPYYQCNICQGKFKTKTRIKHHAFCAMGENDMPYKCVYDQCGRGFTAKDHYQYHLRSHTGEKPFVCHCGKAFTHQSTLAKHKRSHNTPTDPMGNNQEEEENESHSCVETENMTPPDLIPYFITVLQEKPPSYRCNFCRKKFTTKLSFKFHMFCEKGDWPWKCHCGKGFIYQGQYEYHLQFAHQSISPDKRKQILSRYQELKRHAKKPKHMKRRPSFVCNHKKCEKRYPQRSLFKRHLMSHLKKGDLPFKCLICGASFRLMYILVRHITKTHSEPKKAAEKLANEACLKYLEEKKMNWSPDDIPASQIPSVVMTTAIKNASRRVLHEWNNSKFTRNSDSISLPSFSSCSPTLSFSSPRSPIQSAEASSDVEEKEIEVITLD